jgi:pyridoxal phosphate enzyme (YggS family)
MAAMPSTLTQRLSDLRAEIETAARRSGRQGSEVTLVAVTKSAPPGIFATARAAGITDVGENRAQDALKRMAGYEQDFRWHFVGHLQANKVRKLVPVFDVFHGIDDVDLARRVDRIAGELGRCPELLLQVNVSGEAAKQGLDPEALPAALEALSELSHARLIGLMTMAPRPVDDATPGANSGAEAARPVFAALRELRDRCAAPGSLPHLSMGMSGDFVVAIEEGATLIRVGALLVDGLD